MQGEYRKAGLAVIRKCSPSSIPILCSIENQFIEKWSDGRPRPSGGRGRPPLHVVGVPTAND